MARLSFLLILALPLLHLVQATTCRGANCPTGEFYLELDQQKQGFNNINKINENLFFLISIAGLIIAGGSGTATSIETLPADDLSCNIPPFPAPGNPSSSFYSPPKGERATPSLSSTTGVNWSRAEGNTRGLESLASLGAVGKKSGQNTQH